MSKDKQITEGIIFRRLDAGPLSRREFLAMAGMATAALAVNKDGVAQSPRAVAADGFDQRLDVRTAQLADTHDIVSLPNWGPYSKKYFGISHIPDVKRGLSFDLSLFPALATGPTTLPSVTDRSGVHPWEASSDLDFYSLRFETIANGKLYSDVSYCRLSDSSRLIRMELVNQTETPQELVLHGLAQLCFPPLREITAEPIRLCTVELPKGARWVHALDYVDLTFAKPRPTDTLVPDGKFRGEARHHDCVGGSAVAERFGHDAGDKLHYRLHAEHAFTDAVLICRFQLDRGQSFRFEMDGVTKREIVFQGNGELTTLTIPIGRLAAGVHDLRLTSTGGSAILLNGFVLAEASQASAVRFPEKPWNQTPEISAVGPSGILIKYPNEPSVYGLSLDIPLALQQMLKWRDLDTKFQNHSSDYTRARIFGKGKDNAGDPDSLFIHALSPALTVPAKGKRTVCGIVCTGDEAAVRKTLTAFDPSASQYVRTLSTGANRAFQFSCSPSGEPFLFGQQRMAAVTLTNIVYPLHTQGNYIRHYSPGKIWDCLYTWDSGFIGLGLLELDPQRALENLNAYTTRDGAQSAFIHHGTPLATQIYLYRELWNRTQSREMLAYFYPRLRQFYRFVAGRLGSSTTRKHQDELLVTWDYFYNSGGWDDYPPQKFVHQQDLVATATPTVSSAHAIRCAKMLRQTAIELGHEADCAEYDKDIAQWSHSLQQFSWDADSGYFGYVMHDALGKPNGILRTADGVNFNMGLDGVTPLVAGICNAEQTRSILERLFSSQHMWTDIGITSVDQSAPYYRTDGYWNGNVWLAHQWFLWKSMLDVGRGDLAVRIAQTGLDLWKKATEATGDCLEHFAPHEPYGFGWVQFSSLSSPALSWFAALYTPGRFTCGHDVWIHSLEFRENNRELRAKISVNSSNPEFSILACMQPGSEYKAFWNGVPVNSTVAHDSLLQVQLPTQSSPGELLIRRV